MATKLGDITLSKQTGTTLTLSTECTYVNTDVSFDIDVQLATAVTTASADASVQSDETGRNISGSIGTKTETQPSSGYFLKVGATGTGSTTVSTAGWVDTGSLGNASANETKYFPVDAATAGISGSNTVTPSASISGSNITLSNTDNGISVTATGGGTASAVASAISSHAGYVPDGATMASGTINGANQSTTASSFISGVILNKPESGTRSFAITIPNGNSDTLTLTFTVDSNGNTTIE